LVEKSAAIGGHARETGCKATDVCQRCNACVADEVLRTVPTLPNVSVHTETQVAAVEAGRNGRRFTARLSGPDGERQIDIDAVVVAIGYRPYDPAENSSYGYSRATNVITGKEAEMQLAAEHGLTRPSDGQPPKRVAFVQCVGSRTEEIFRRPDDTDYCSVVCCAYGLRMARRLEHRVPGVEITVFYMDLQNFGKGFDDLLGDCRSRMRFVRSRPSEIGPGADGIVRVTYTPAGESGGGCVTTEEFDLVVLAVGMRPPEDAERLADTLGVPLDENGFVGLRGISCMPDLQREGVFAAGACESPKDIAGCMAQAEAVSALVLSEV